MMMAFAAAMMSSMSSCDEDIDEAMVLSGEWQGDFGMYYTVEHKGRIYTYDSYDSELIFIPDYDYATHGEGREVDYYEYGPYRYQYFSFSWRIVDGVIKLRYHSDPKLNVDIHEYHIDNDWFSGYFGFTDNRFSLRKTVDHYDWTPYVNSNYYGDARDEWNWSRSEGRAVEAAESHTDPESDEFVIVGFGNRNNP